VSGKRPRLRVGDVFSIPLDDERVGYGQIVHRWGKSGGHFYFAVFDGAHPRDEDVELDAVLSEPLAFLALSMDPLLVNGHWRVVGNRDVDPEGFPWPDYREGVSPGVFEIVDYTGQRRRRATEREAEKVPFRTVVAPILVEDALKARYGLVPWDHGYDKLRPPDHAQ
jgi:hypothetical protein